MSLSSGSLGKSLMGTTVLSDAIQAQATSSVVSAITSGTVEFNNVTITSGTIDGTVIGGNQAGPAQFTTLQTGNTQGIGYSVCFYGNIVGDSACWIPNTGTWNIQGDLLVRDISDLGNLRISQNTLSSTNTNGNVNIISNGTGVVSITGGLSQATSTGNITLQTISGHMTTTVGTDITFTSGINTNIYTKDGNITLQTTTAQTSYTINFITTGNTPTITTTTSHDFEVGDTIVISGTNSTPTINGTYTVLSVPTSNTLTISPGVLITHLGTTGNIIKQNVINLNAKNYVNIIGTTPLTFYSSTQQIYSDTSNNLFIKANNNINLIPTTAIIIPDNIPLEFGSSTQEIYSDGTNLNINTGTGNLIVNTSEVIINGNFQVNGSISYIESTVTTIQEPIFFIGLTGTSPPAVNDNKWRGIEFGWNNGNTAKTGFFGMNASTGCFVYIQDATNTNGIITGALGCAQFGALTVSSLNVQGGTINNISTLNTCNINCSGDLSITATNSSTITSPTNTIAGNLIVNGNAAAINSTVLTINSTTTNNNSSIFTLHANLPVIGLSSSSTDKGIIFNTPTGQGYFGYSSASNCFEFIPSATISSGIVSGALGNLCIGTVNASIVNANSSVITTMSSTTVSTTTLNTCSILCNNNLTITSSGSITNNATSYIINASSFTTTANLPVIGTTSNVDKGVLFNTPSGQGYFGYSSTSNCFEFIPSATVSSGLVTGALGNLCINTVNASSLNTCNITCSGNLSITGTSSITLNSTGNTSINSATTSILDKIPSISGNQTILTDDLTSRGIQFQWNNSGTPQTGFFGFIRSSNCFSFIPNASIIGGIVSGSVGNICANTLNSTTVNTSTLNTCNINCTGSLSITASNNFTITSGSSNTLFLNSGSVSSLDPIPLINEAYTTGVDKGISFGNGSATGFFGVSGGCFTYINNATITNKIVSGSPGCANFADTTVNNLTVNGTLLVAGGITTTFTTQHLTISSGSLNPNNVSNITFINVTGTNATVTGTIGANTIDGFIKIIIISTLASGASYVLSFPAGRYTDAGSGSSISKTATFTRSGQSMTFIWDNNNQIYICISGNTCLSTP